jgi:uncharacterized protein
MMEIETFTPGILYRNKNFVLITGATGGLGKAFAVECASRGWNPFLTDLRPDALRTLAEGLQNSYGVTVRYQPCDLSDSDARSGLLESFRAQRLRFWGLVNVAGTDYEGTFHQLTRRQVQTILRVNIEATLDLSHSLLELRDPTAAFRIVNVASLAAFYPMPVKATYAASKRFLLDFSLALREEVRELGATVTVLCPGALYTNPDCIAAIEAQGLAGHLTAQSIGGVALKTLDYALEGRALYIPGFFNQFLHTLGGFIPAQVTAGFISRRWRSAHRKRRESLQEAAL